MLGWLVAVLVTIPDGLVWSELGAAMPGSGGSYVYLREAYGRERFGRLVAFLFIWQFILSGPLEIASGYIGFSRYARYIWPDLTSGHVFLVAAGVGLLNVDPALPTDRSDRDAHGQPLDWHAADDGSPSSPAARSISTRRARSTFRRAPSISRSASCSASAPRPASGSTTISATTTSATSATRSRIPGA